MAGYASLPVDSLAEWRASALLHRAVVHARKVELAGQVLDVIFNPQTSAVSGLMIGPRGLEGSLFDLLHKLFGTSYGLSLITTDQVLAMDADVVMLDVHPARAAVAAYAAHLPRLSAMRGLPVITAHGRKLGRFVDLLLAGDGRRIVGYVVEQPTATRPSPTTLLDRIMPVMDPADQSGTRAAPSATGTPTPPAAAKLLVVTASNSVRFGRELIVVGAGESPRVSIPSAPVAQPAPGPAAFPIPEPTALPVPEPGPQSWPVMSPQTVNSPNDTDTVVDGEHPTESPDAPTEAIQP